jgi:hypothetical protein
MVKPARQTRQANLITHDPCGAEDAQAGRDALAVPKVRRKLAGRTGLTQRQTERIIKAVVNSGIEIGEVKAEPDGTIRVIAAGRAEGSADAALDAWERQRAAGKA